MYRQNPYDCGCVARIREINAQYPKTNRTVTNKDGTVTTYDYRQGIKTVTTKSGKVITTLIAKDEQ